MDIKFSRNISDEKVLNAEKCQNYSFYRSWVIKGKPTGGKITIPQTSRLGLNLFISEYI